MMQEEQKTEGKYGKKQVKDADSHDRTAHVKIICNCTASGCLPFFPFPTQVA